MAQRIEHLTTDQKVGGSNPSGCASIFRSQGDVPLTGLVGGHHSPSASAETPLPWPTNRPCVRPWIPKGRSPCQRDLVGPKWTEPLTSALSARPRPYFEQDQQCAESPFKTYLTRDFRLDQLCRSLRRRRRRQQRQHRSDQRTHRTPPPHRPQALRTETTIDCPCSSYSRRLPPTGSMKSPFVIGRLVTGRRHQSPGSAR